MKMCLKAAGQAARVGLVVVLAVSFVACSAEPRERAREHAALGARRGGPDENGIVVVISVDGLAGFYLDDPNAQMPTIRALAAAGARASSMRAVTPTVTWPNHTTLVTGVMPARHGVVGNNYYDRATNQRVQLIADPLFDKDQIVKVPTIYDLASAAGMKTAGIRWPASRNASTLNWAVPDVWSIELLRRYTTPSLMREGDAAGIKLDGSDLPPSPEKGRLPFHIDPTMTRAFNLILREHRPRLALLHLTDVDHDQHSAGPRTPEAYAAIKEADEQVRDVWDEMQRDFPGNATLVIVSDHGFSPIKHIVLPNVILRDAGLIDVKGTRIVGGNVVIVPQGGSALVYITPRPAKDSTQPATTPAPTSASERTPAAAAAPDGTPASASALKPTSAPAPALTRNERDAIVARIKKALTGHDGIARIVGPDELHSIGVADPKDDPHAPDMVLYAPMGCVFGDTAAGALSYNEKPERSGSHGHDPMYPDLHATFVACGVGVSPGMQLGEIPNTDVAPTVASLLGLTMKDVEGKALPLASAK